MTKFNLCLLGQRSLKNYTHITLNRDMTNVFIVMFEKKFCFLSVYNNNNYKLK